MLSPPALQIQHRICCNKMVSQASDRGEPLRSSTTLRGGWRLQEHTSSEGRSAMGEESSGDSDHPSWGSLHDQGAHITFCRQAHFGRTESSHAWSAVYEVVFTVSPDSGLGGQPDKVSAPRRPASVFGNTYHGTSAEVHGCARHVADSVCYTDDAGISTIEQPARDHARLMAAGLNLKLTRASLSHTPEREAWAKGPESCWQEVIPPAEEQECSRHHFFSNPAQWCDSRHSQPTSRHSSVKHKRFKVDLWSNKRHKPAQEDSQLATLDTQWVSTSTFQRQGALGTHESQAQEVAKCWKLCSDGQISEAVDALNHLLLRGCRIPHNLLYRVLKRCVAQKDLVLGRCVHALTVKSGYERDAFLATQLIGLYSSHGRLGEAMQVFAAVSTPNVYNWASIIFAYARHGQADEAAEAIRLYRRMLESTAVKPDDRIYSAVLKACATAGNLIFGKEVHAHILAGPGEPDSFVQAALVDMYAKCGSLQDARQVFDRLPDKTVVTWTAMIAGYAQQGQGNEALRLYRNMQKEGIVPPNSITYLCLLQACASVGAGALVEGKQLHAKMTERGLHEDVVLGGSLVNMYAKCGSLEDARSVFQKLPKKNAITWNAMLAGYAQQGMGEEALCLYNSMEHDSLVLPNHVTYVSVLQACACVGVGALQQGKKIHGRLRERGLQKDPVLGGSLVNMYAKCGSLQDARKLFDKLPERNVVAWTAMLAGYAQQGMGQEALSLYSRMKMDGFSPPDCVTFACLLRACASVGAGALNEGKQLDAQIREQGFQGDTVLGSSLVNMYARCGSLEDARNVFNNLREKTVVAWTAMIAGYAQQGMALEAFSLYGSMQQQGFIRPNSVTYVCLLQACASIGAGALYEGKQLHAQIKEQGLEEDVALGSSLVNMYAKCGSLEDARSMFEKLTERTVVAWTAMLAGYAQQGMGQEALDLYSSMQQEGLIPPDSVTYVCLLRACASVGAEALHYGKQLHAQVKELELQEDVFISGSLVNMYAKCGSLHDAHQVFVTLPERNIVTWNAMIAGYAQQGLGHEALGLYSSMQQEGTTRPDSVTYVCLLQACASVGVEALQKGKLLHERVKEEGLERELVVGSSLVNMYARCGGLEDAHRIFDQLPERNVVTWNAMIAGYVQQGLGQEALKVYDSMQREGLVSPNSATYACLLQACAVLAALPLGKQLHSEIEERGVQGDEVVGAALVNMYAKCGSMLDSQWVFDTLPKRSIEAWGALIGGYARQGDSEVVFNLFDKMELEGMQPDAITFLSVLTVCSHAGLVDEGRKYFEVMRTDYGIHATVDHLTCMMDLLGRAGHLDEALQMAKSMPFSPTSAVWLTLLGACRKWSNVEIGQQAFELAVALDGKDAASYVLMSNIYARAKMWPEAKEMQARRKERGAWKKPGQSWWTDMCGKVHTFVVGDMKHLESDGIYARLEQLVHKIKKAGYVPHLDSSLRDLPDDEKEADLCGHSEKLAIAFALNKTPEGSTIRIVKNLRVCMDCHLATAYISKVEMRTIICRDASRFHVFKDGKCSCGDYW